jgi:hypothetical protein
LGNIAHLLWSARTEETKKLPPPRERKQIEPPRTPAGYRKSSSRRNPLSQGPVRPCRSARLGPRGSEHLAPLLRFGGVEAPKIIRRVM